MKVAAVQHDIVWEDPEANFTRLAPRIADAAAAGARLVVLTEMYSTGFSSDTVLSVCGIEPRRTVPARSSKWRTTSGVPRNSIVPPRYAGDFLLRKNAVSGVSW